MSAPVVFLLIRSTQLEVKLCFFSVLQVSALAQSSGDAVFKFEPFVLHVQCRQLEDAQLMVSKGASIMYIFRLISVLLIRP